MLLDPHAYIAVVKNGKNYTSTVLDYNLLLEKSVQFYELFWH